MNVPMQTATRVHHFFSTALPDRSPDADGGAPVARDPKSPKLLVSVSDADHPHRPQ
jgi:hypothetical protein